MKVSFDSFHASNRMHETLLRTSSSRILNDTDLSPPIDNSHLAMPKFG